MSPITNRGVASILIGFSLGLAGCASEASTASDPEQAEVEGTTSALPVAAVSMTGASFAGLGAATGALGTGSAIGTNSATGTVGTSAGVGGSFSGGPTSFGSSFGTGPVGFSSSTGPINFGTSFNTGPVEFNTGGTTTISSGTGSAPVISTTCTGFGCP